MSQEPPVLEEVAKFAMEEIFPLQKDVVPVLQGVVNLRLGLVECLTRRRLKALECEFVNLAARRVAITDKLVNLDKLISPDDPNIQRKVGLLLLRGELTELLKQEARISELMDSLDKILSSKRNEANFRVIALLSFVAILTAVASLLIQAFS